MIHTSIVPYFPRLKMRKRLFVLLLNICSLFGLSVAIVASCGSRPGQSRIVGGTTAAHGSWPWQLSLRYSGGHICGASLISEDYAITAAHCVDHDSRPSSYAIVAGKLSTLRDDRHEMMVNMKLVEITKSCLSPCHNHGNRIKWGMVLNWVSFITAKRQGLYNMPDYAGTINH